MNNNYVNVLHNFPQMHLTKVKYEMLSTVSLGQAIGLSLFPLKSVAVNRDQLIKMQKEFPDLSSTTYYSIYDHKGYVATYKNPDYTFNFNDKSSKVPLPNPEQIRYLKKIAKYCEIRQIQLLLITQPILPAYKKAIKNYDPVYNQINEVSKKIEVPYYDMNKIDPLQDSNFYDTGHLLHKGALQFSSNTASFLKQNDFSNASGK
jgi:hypothetical protein